MEMIIWKGVVLGRLWIQVDVHDLKVDSREEGIYKSEQAGKLRSRSKMSSYGNVYDVFEVSIYLYGLAVGVHAQFLASDFGITATQVIIQLT